MKEQKQKETIINTKDYLGRRVFFAKKKWEKKSLVHPELTRKKFIENIKKALESPDQVWKDYSDIKNKRCYYKKYSTRSYIKVVVWVGHNPYQVVTAFETDYIKEEKYRSKIKQIK